MQTNKNQELICKQTISARKNAKLEYWDRYKVLRVDHGISSYTKIACAR